MQLNNLGVIALETNELERAEELFHAAIEEDPGWPDAHMNLGIVQTTFGRSIEESRASYQTVIQLSPENATAHLNLGMAQLGFGEFEEGWREYLWRMRSDRNDCISI